MVRLFWNLSMNVVLYQSWDGNSKNIIKMTFDRRQVLQNGYKFIQR